MKTATAKPDTVFEWNNVDWDYPSCGGTIGSVTDDGVVTIEHQSNMSGYNSGNKYSAPLNEGVLEHIINNDQYNRYYTYREMIISHAEYLADFNRMTTIRKGRIVR
jgi:hypothetical protein